MIVFHFSTIIFVAFFPRHSRVKFQKSQIGLYTHLFHKDKIINFFEICKLRQKNINEI